MRHNTCPTPLSSFPLTPPLRYVCLCRDALVLQLGTALDAGLQQQAALLQADIERSATAHAVTELRLELETLTADLVETKVLLASSRELEVSHQGRQIPENHLSVYKIQTSVCDVWIRTPAGELDVSHQVNGSSATICLWCLSSYASGGVGREPPVWIPPVLS